MKNKFALFMGTALVLGMGFTSGTSHAESPAAQLQIKRAGPSATIPSGPATLAMPAQMKCTSGFNKTEEHKNHNGASDRMTCQSQTIECPHKSTIKNKDGNAASGQGIDVKKVPVGGVGDSNKFKIEYSCTYIWAQG